MIRRLRRHPRLHPLPRNRNRFSPSSVPAPAAKEPEPVLAFEDVRAILADKSREGFTAQIRDLLQKYGASKLSEVDPAHYKALIADVEGLSNG